MGNKLDSEVAIEVLRAVKRPQSVSELVASLRRRNEAVIHALSEMGERGLVERRVERGGGRGRPRVVVSSTSLGEDYLDAYDRLSNIALKATPTGLRRAVADAEYASRLKVRGLDPFQLFLELNEHVRSAKGAG